MARCKCGGAGGFCSCAGAVTFASTPEVEFLTTGAGTTQDPLIVTASLPQANFQGGNPGDVLTQQPDGSYAPGPPNPAPVGAITTGVGLVGDGSGAAPLRVYFASYDELKAAGLP